MSAATKRALLLASLVLATTGCKEVVGNISAIDATVILTGPRSPIPAVVAKGVQLSRTLAGVAVVLLGFVLWYRIHQGRPWVEMLYDLLIWSAVCLYLLRFMGSPWGPDRWIFEAGRYLGGHFQVQEGALWANLWRTTSKLGDRVLLLQDAAGKATVVDMATRKLQAFATVLSSPWVAGGFMLNASGMWIIDRMAHIFWVWLMGFYWMVGSLLIWTVVLPQTRYVFLGWLKSYISVALWPLFFSLAEQLMVAIPVGSWLGVDGGGKDPAAIVSSLMQSNIMLIALNVVTLGIYIAIPVASYKIVNGASTPFRGIKD